MRSSREYAEMNWSAGGATPLNMLVRTVRKRSSIGETLPRLLVAWPPVADHLARYEFVEGTDLVHELPEIIVPVQVHVVAMLVRVVFFPSR